MKYSFPKSILLRFFPGLLLLLLHTGAVNALSVSESLLTAGDPGEGGQFGRSVAVHGDIVVVGAPEGSDDAAVGPGAAHLHESRRP
ncbi:MAG: FG-GAP repeat protein [Syntrophobacteraceae bacterium]|jgi:hypothetical protein|nr:FG-GAP repeat protein [Syntrophobacteraceae bacterium]